jgi:hypothetical protein
MEHSPEHHIEEAEHAQHAARDPFDRRVTMSIAIVAAILACITMLGHREHNATLLLQGEAIQLQSQGGVVQGRANDQWNYYQGQKLRYHLYQGDLEMLDELAALVGKNKEFQSGAKKTWEKRLGTYESRFESEKVKAKKLEEDVKGIQEKAEEKIRQSHHSHLRAHRFDLGELGVELALVLCSVAVLTKRGGFWYVGLVSCGVGTLVALSGLLDLFMSTGH